MYYNILNVNEKAVFDNSIISAQQHTHLPYVAHALNNNDEIRIPIQQQDLYTFPRASAVYIEGKVITSGGTATAPTPRFVNNGVMSLFEEVRYELAGNVVDSVRNPGIACTMKGYLSFNKNKSDRLQIAGWFPLEDSTIIDEKGNFNVMIPLKMFFGFCEDFEKIVLNLRQELVLKRSSSDVNAIIDTDKARTAKIELHKVIWKMPYISVADAERLRLISFVSSNINLQIPFRVWSLHEYPQLQQTQKQTWAIKTSTQIEKPRYVIVGFQTGRKNQVDKDVSKFDHCNLTNIKLYLNSERYPYDNLNINFDSNQFAILYEMYAQFQEGFYGKEEPLFTPRKFKEIAPLAVIDCSHQNEVLKAGPVDIMLEFESNKNFPANTTVYCLIIHDRLVTYNPLTNQVKIANSAD